MEKSCGCVVFNDNKVLIVKSLNGVYGFPKGHIEENETDVECAIRETFEETGIEVKIEKAAGVKCPRCWTFSEEAGTDAEHPELCPRCTAVVKG